EVERRGRCRSRRDRRRWWHVVKASAVLVMNDNKQRRSPVWSVAQCVVTGNQALSGGNAMGRMLVVREVHVRHVSGLDERLGRQIAVFGIVEEIIEQEEIQGEEPKPRRFKAREKSCR